MQLRPNTAKYKKQKKKKKKKMLKGIVGKKKKGWTSQVVQSLPPNEGNTGLIAGPGRFHMLRSN